MVTAVCGIFSTLQKNQPLSTSSVTLVIDGREKVQLGHESVISRSGLELEPSFMFCGEFAVIHRLQL